MRLLLALALASLLPKDPGADSSQTTGIYRAQGEPAAEWSINEHHTLFWNGVPYLPVGLRIPGTPTAIAGAKAQGILDVLLELPASGAGWAEAIAACESGGMRYLIAINSLAPLAEGFVVEPQGYRIDGITKNRVIDVPLPGSKSALVVIATRRDGAVQSSERIATAEGRLRYEAKPRNTLEHVVLIYPETSSVEQPDYWDGLDVHRDQLLRALRQNPPGGGFRGLLNPMGTVLQFGRKDGHHVPTSPYFRQELALHLEAKYRNLETAQRGWSLRASDINSWRQLARMVPLWSGSRGVSHLWDPETDRLYLVNQRSSQAWTDIHQVISQTSARRYQRLAAALRRQVDVPIVQEWAGWLGPYALTERSTDGLAMSVSGTSPLAIAEAASRVTSTALRSRHRTWLIAGSIALGPSGDPSTDLRNVLDDLSALGARGWFMDARTTKATSALAEEAQRRGADTSFAQWSPKSLYFPENALNPSLPQRLAGGTWWLPSPVDGNRLDLGSGFFGYRYRDGLNSYTAIWALKPGRVKLLMLEPRAGTFTTIDGSDPNPRQVRGGVEVTLGEFPLLISGTEEIPVPELAYQETLSRFEEMAKLFEKLGVDPAEDRFLFSDALAGFERNPGGAFASMRQTYHRMNLKLGRFTWIEAETCRNTNFSEAVSLAGCSAGGALNLRTTLPTDGAYFAEFNLPVKTDQPQDVWIAGRIPFDKRPDFEVLVDGKSLQIEAEPLSYYGFGFAWYRVGQVELKTKSPKLRVQVRGQTSDLAVDVILLTPERFVPSGVTQPDAIAFTPIKR